MAGIDELIAHGEAQFAAGEVNQAVATFRRALADEPDNRDAACNLAVALFGQGNVEAARRLMFRVLAACPNHPAALLNLAILEARSQHRGPAATALRALQRTDCYRDEATAELLAIGLDGSRRSGPGVDLSHELAGAEYLVTVVVLDDFGPAVCGDLLDRLALQRLELGLFEVLLVGTGDEPTGLPFVCRRVADLKAAAQQAGGRFAVVLRADFLPSEGNLVQHVEHQLTHDAKHVVMGDPTPALDPLARLLWHEDIRSLWPRQEGMHPRCLQLNNVSLPSQLLSDALPCPGDFVDTRLGAALHQRGVQLHYAPAIASDRRPLGCEPPHSLGTAQQRVQRFRRAQFDLAATLAQLFDHASEMPLANVLTAPHRQGLQLRSYLDFLRWKSTHAAELLCKAVDQLPRRELPEAEMGLVARAEYLRAIVCAGICSGSDPEAAATADALLTSVVVPNLNGMPHLKRAVSSLREHTDGPWELIVVDNGSNDGSVAWLRQQSDVVLIEADHNMGAPAARNIGLGRARGETVVLCDNDVVFTPNWRAILIHHLYAWPDIGMVGPVTGYVAEGPQKLADEIPEDIDAFALSTQAALGGHHTYSPRLIMFCVMMRRELFDKIGGIDEAFNPWGFEDDDYSLRVRLAGFHQRVARDCFILHIGSQTSDTADLDYKSMLKKNWTTFKHKWGLAADRPYEQGYNSDDVLAGIAFDPTLHYVDLAAKGDGGAGRR